MTKEEQEALNEELDRGISENKPWVAYNDRSDKVLPPQNLRFFRSAGEAGQFCEEANNEFDFAEQMFNWDNYRYIQVSTLKAELGDSPPAIAVDISAIVREMAEQRLYLPPGKTIDELEATLEQGGFFPVLWQRQIDPLKEIAGYCLVGHQERRIVTGEIVHSHKVYERCSNYEEARDFMKFEILHLDFHDRGMDFILNGLFHDAPFGLDEKGFAVPQTGLALQAAYPNKAYSYDFREVYSLFEPVMLKQYFFAGLHGGKLALFDEKLKLTRIDIPQRPFYPTHFNYNYLTIKNSNVMNEQSFDYVKNQLLYLGFGEEIARPLREKLEQNLTEFTLPHTRKFGQDETNSVLHFSKGNQQDKDMTFFNRADITLKQPGKEDLTQTFFFGKEHNYTLQERYNMMDGRAAYREQPKMAPVEENGDIKMKPTGETYFAWRGLDFKNADQYGNFNPKVMFWNHEKEVGKYPIKGIEDDYDKQRILAKLEKGNKVDVTLLRDGNETQAKLVANPRMARLDFYDSNGQSLIVRKTEKQAVDQTQNLELTPQEVQKTAIARAAEQQQSSGANQQHVQKGEAREHTATEQQQDQGQAATRQQSQNDTVKEQVAADQKQEPRRRQGIRV
jgi:hypothetical protein